MEACEGSTPIHKATVLPHWGFNLEKDTWNLILETVLSLSYTFGINRLALISRALRILQQSSIVDN